MLYLISPCLDCTRRKKVSIHARPLSLSLTKSDCGRCLVRGAVCFLQSHTFVVFFIPFSFFQNHCSSCQRRLRWVRPERLCNNKLLSMRYASEQECSMLICMPLFKAGVGIPARGLPHHFSVCLSPTSKTRQVMFVVRYFPEPAHKCTCKWKSQRQL